MSNVSHILDRFGSRLVHKQADTGSSSGGSGSTPSARFVESKVKRDGRGRFSSKSSSNVDLTYEELEAKHKQELIEKFGVEATEMSLGVYLNTLPADQRKGVEDDIWETVTRQTLELVELSEKRKDGLFDLKQSDFDDREAFLAHYGVRGMKWGVRRSARQLARARTERIISDDAAQAYVYKAQARKAGVASLDNRQLQELNRRLELESKYNQWAAKNPTLKRRATKFIAEELKKEGLKRAADVGEGSQVARVIEQVRAKRKATGTRRM